MSGARLGGRGLVEGWDYRTLGEKVAVEHPLHRCDVDLGVFYAAGGEM